MLNSLFLVAALVPVNPAVGERRGGAEGYQDQGLVTERRGGAEGYQDQGLVTVRYGNEGRQDQNDDEYIDDDAYDESEHLYMDPVELRGNNFVLFKFCN